MTRYFQNGKLWDVMNSEQRTANSEQRTANSEQRTANSEQRTANSEQRTANSEQRTANSASTTQNKKISLELYRIIFEVSSDGMFITDAQAKICHVNPAFTRITGFEKNEVLGKNPSILSSGRQDACFYQNMWQNILNAKCWQGEIWNKKKNQEVFPVWQTINAVGQGDNIEYYISVFSDISKLKEAEQQLWHLAHFDSLTGLANRKLLEKRVKQEISICKRLQHYSALLFLDLDEFKTVNDSLGHKMGDILLTEVAQCLKQELREEDIVSRLGGDEFIILLTNLSADKEKTISHVVIVVDKILDALTRPFFVQQHELRISASIGITLLPNQDSNVEQLLKQADTAMYAAKANGRNGYSFYYPEMQQKADTRLLLKKELHQALADNQFDLLYQPQYDKNRKLLGCEALIRWHHPEKGTISPADFIPVAENNGLIIEIGEQIMAQACQQLIVWQQQGHHVPHLSINISPRQFVDKYFVEMVSAIVHRSDVNPQQIILEITEGLIVKDIRASIEKMNALKKLGFKFSIDDFGTGYSSLSYLTRLPIDELKIDRSFVCNIEKNPTDTVIVDTIVAMAKHLHLNLVAEGVETEEQLRFLLNCGCQCFQGYYFCKPVPGNQVFT